MSEALGYIWYTFSGFLDFVFDDLEFFEGVTVGWVIVSCIVFGLLIRSILNIPRSMSVSSTNSIFKRKEGSNNG